MSAHHGPPCGHTVPGTCVGCGGRAPMEPPGGWTTTNATRTYAPVTVKVAAEAMAKAMRDLDALRRAQAENELRMFEWLTKPMVFVDPPKDPQQDAFEFRMHSYIGIGPTIQGTFYIPPDPVDPLDVKHDGVTLRELLRVNERECRDGKLDGGPMLPLTPVQRAAVSAHWSAELRAKIAASEAADAARRPSAVVEVDDW